MVKNVSQNTSTSTSTPNTILKPSLKDKIIEILENVNYINEDTKIYADKAELNLLNNELKISMINAEDKVQINGKY